MSRWAARSVVALITAVVMTGTAAPASADVKWATAECLSGTIDATVVTGDDLLLEGQVDCADDGKGSRFGVAHYYTDSVAMYLSTMRHYGSGASTAFAVGKPVRNGSGTFALCVVTDYQVRLACVRVGRPVAPSTTQTGTPIVVTPLATDDQYVTRMVDAIVDDVNSASSPACGHCW